MKQRFFLTVLFVLLAVCRGQADDSVVRFDSLLTSYSHSSGRQRRAAGQEIIKISAAQDELLESVLTLHDGMLADSVNFLVWFAAERFYYNNSYFEESLDYITRALPLAKGNNLDLHATLLCDRGYCLFKTSRNAEATEAELAAEKFAKQHRLLLPLARSYNYLAIIDLTLGYIDEAKHFVAKAIETDGLTGSDVNTHNYLGIACEVYSVAKEPERAVEYGLKAVEAARKIGYDAGVVNHLSQLSYAYNRQGNLEKALEMSLEAVSTVEKMPIVDRNLLAISLEYVAFNLLDMKRNSEAVPYIRRAIALQQELGNRRSVCYDHKSLAEALEPDAPREALTALRRYSAMMDSLHYDEMHTVLSKANAQLHNDELQGENAQRRRENRIILVSAILVGLLALAVIAALVYAVRTRNRSMQAMRRLQRVREEFFTNITHEFRTPLTVIMGIAEQQKLPVISRNANHLLSLVNQLLDIAKVKASVGHSDWQRADIIPLLTMLVENYQESASSQGIKLLFQPESSPVVVDHVADYVQKVVGNLLTNALKYTPEGGTISLATRVAGQQLQLVVADTGRGIHPDDLPHVFEPFYQSTHTPAVSGTGIGLAFCHEIVKASHGTITAESTLGEGSTFTVTIPLRQTGVVLSEPSAPAVTTAPETPPQTLAPGMSATDDADDDTRLRVLVVEDNHDVAAYIGSVLAPTYEVVYAADGQEGIEKAEALVPDVIVTDVMMPGTDGLQLCRRIRANHITDHIPVIVITARVTDDDRLRGIEAGADAYLTKPFRADELRLRVSKLLEQRRRLLEKLPPKPQEGSADDASSDSGLPIAHAFLDKLDGVIMRQMAQGDIETKTVAAELCMSLSQFARKLRAVADTTPAAYITARRMQEARRMLSESPKYSVTDVALRCGFADASHFSHAFRRIYGITPTQFVKSLQ